MGRTSYKAGHSLLPPSFPNNAQGNYKALPQATDHCLQNVISNLTALTLDTDHGEAQQNSSTVGDLTYNMHRHADNQVSTSQQLRHPCHACTHT